MQIETRKRSDVDPEHSGAEISFLLREQEERFPRAYIPHAQRSKQAQQQPLLDYGAAVIDQIRPTHWAYACRVYKIDCLERFDEAI